MGTDLGLVSIPLRRCRWLTGDGTPCLVSVEDERAEEMAIRSITQAAAGSQARQGVCTRGLLRDEEAMWET